MSENDPAPDSRPSSRQELYERIRRSSKDEIVLEDMVRLGFWPAEKEVPTVPAQIIRRQGELGRELSALITEKARLADRERMLRELRKRRLAEALQKRQETKERREREREERAAAWLERKKRDIVYVGAGVSAGLNHKESQADRLLSFGLPKLADAAEIAAAMGIDVGELRFLTFARKTARINHYRRFLIPKKTGGTRLISAPMPRLKEAQRWLLDNVLAKVPVHDAVRGFLAGRSIVDNARPHLRAEVVVNLDLKDFFPTVTYSRVKGVFRALGYSEHAATLFALLTTEPDVEEVTLDGESYFVAAGDRHLPQGAPTSPALTNVICGRLDRRLAALASRLGFAYTRYADDLSFSTSGESVRNVGNLLRGTAEIVVHEGFQIHPDKTRVMRRGRRQEVTGIVVNDKLGIDRRTLRRFRATLHQVERNGPEGKHWGGNEHVVAALEGFASYVTMVDREKGAPLIARVRRLMQQTGYRPALWPRRPKRVPSWKSKGAAPRDSREGAPSTGARLDGPSSPAKRPWWKFW